MKNHYQARKVSGIILLDKPSGITSNVALQRIKKLFQARKAGHTGSLDPLANGMLPICLGEATKFCQFLLAAPKHYQVKAKLGEKTTTGDTEGEIIARCAVPTLDEAMILAILAKFQGTIAQVPSMFSALKHHGQPLYKLARQGIEVEREARQVTIYELELLELTEQTFTLAVHCSKGTYVRTLVEDIGAAIGCGAHVTQLRRTHLGPYNMSQMLTFAKLNELFTQFGLAGLDKQLLPLDSSIGQWPAIYLAPAALYYLQRGSSVLTTQASKLGWVRIYAKNGQFLGVGEVNEPGKVSPRRLIS